MCVLGLGCHGGEGGEGRGGKKAEAYPIREYWGRGERGGSRNTEVGKERETLRCKVRKGAGTQRERGAGALWSGRKQNHQEAGQAGAQGCREETGTLRRGRKPEHWGGMGQLER